jgi:hypothetical protein
MGERAAARSVGRRRVLVEDTRRDGRHLRATWHADERQFVVSTWQSDVCTGAARLSVGDAAALSKLLVDGLADASRPPERATPKLPAIRPGLPGLIDRMRWLVTGTAPGRAAPPADDEAGTSAAGCAADAANVVRPFTRNSA